jgi:hypothetical protein
MDDAGVRVLFDYLSGKRKGIHDRLNAVADRAGETSAIVLQLNARFVRVEKVLDELVIALGRKQLGELRGETATETPVKDRRLRRASATCEERSMLSGLPS